jgi:hypothetical protein
LEQLKKTDTHLIFKKKSGRYAVKDAATKRWVNGDDKTAILTAEGLIQPPRPKAPEAGPTAETEPAAEAEAESEG